MDPTKTIKSTFLCLFFITTDLIIEYTCTIYTGVLVIFTKFWNWSALKIGYWSISCFTTSELSPIPCKEQYQNVSVNWKICTFLASCILWGEIKYDSIVWLHVYWTLVVLIKNKHKKVLLIVFVGSMNYTVIFIILAFICRFTFFMTKRIIGFNWLEWPIKPFRTLHFFFLTRTR